MLRVWLGCPRNALLLGTGRAVCCRCSQEGSGHCTAAVPVLFCEQGWLSQAALEGKRGTKPAGECSLVSVTLQDFCSDLQAGMAADLFYCSALGINSLFVWTPDVHGLLRVLEGFSGM